MYSSLEHGETLTDAPTISSWRIFIDPAIQQQWMDFRKSLRPFNFIPAYLFTSAMIPTFFQTCLFLMLEMNDHTTESFYRLQKLFLSCILMRIVPWWILTYVLYYKYEEKANALLFNLWSKMGLSSFKNYVSLGDLVIIASTIGTSGLFLLKSAGGQCLGVNRNNSLCSLVASQRMLSYDLYGVILMLPPMLQVFHKGTCWAIIFTSWLIMSTTVVISLYLAGETDVYMWIHQFFVLFNVYSLLRSHESLLEKCFIMKLQQEKLIRSSLKTENENALMDMQTHEIR